MLRLPLARLLPLCALLALVLALPQRAHAQLGIAAGLNFEDFSDIDAGDRNATVDNASGYHVGLFFDLAVGPVALRPGLFYRTVNGVNFEFDPSLDDFMPGSLSDEFDLNLIEVPIDVRFRFAALPLIAPYLTAGPVLTFASSDNEAIDERLQDLSVSADIGVGVELNLIGVRLFPEIRYSIGVTRFLDEYEFGDTTIGATSDEQRLNTVMVRLGVAL